MSACETVRIKFDNEDGFALLNAADFDESKHELFTEPSETENPRTEGIDKPDLAVSVAKTQDAGAAGVKPPWTSKKNSS